MYPLPYPPPPGPDDADGPPTAPSRAIMLGHAPSGLSVPVGTCVLLGRQPPEWLPEGATAVRLADPTHTVSRTHAAVGIDADGTVWVEDCGSRNGTVVADAAGSRRLVHGIPVRVRMPATIHIGDYALTLATA